MQKILVYGLLISSLGMRAQIGLGGLLKEKIKEKTNESFEKKQKLYDESNFNYAILFLDNSSAFEADESGSTFSSTLFNASKLITHEEKTVEERAYTNLKNGEMLFAGNRFYLAEQSLRLAKFLYEQEGETSGTNYAQTVSDLALLYQSRGRYNKAAEYSLQALKLREALSNSGMMLVSINNQAVLEKETGLYAEAETNLMKALEMAVSKGDKLAQALVLNNLAMTYLDMNKLAEADIKMNNSTALAAEVLKENSANYIKLQINKANIYRFEKKYSEAEAIYLNCIDLKEKKLGAHPDLAHLKLGLAQLYMDMGKTNLAEPLLQSAYDIYSHKLGEKNPATLAAKQQQANYYRLMGDATKGLALIAPVVTEKKVIYGDSHPAYIQALEDQALCEWQLNKLGETKEHYKVVINNTLQYISTFFTSLNESEKNVYWEKTNLRLQRFFSFASAQYKTDQDLQKYMFDVLINTKGFLLNNSSKIRQTIFSSADTSMQKVYNNWLQTKEQLNLAYQLSKDEQLAEKINVDSLNLQANALEKELSLKSAVFKSGMENRTVTLPNVQAQLKPGETLVEIVEINDYVNGFTGSSRYLAFVIKAGGLSVIEIGAAIRVDQSVKEFREKIIHNKAENEAYALLWKPMEESLKGSIRIYITLDGHYHQVSLYALKDPTGVYLADKYEFVLLSNSRDLLSLKSSEKTAQKPVAATLFGNPFYGNNGYVQQLDGTEAEVKNIAKQLQALQLKTMVYTGKEATEKQVKDLRSPGMLHFATHGYFLADLNKRSGHKTLGVDRTAAGENPLLRSGLLLANCDNVFDENYKPVLTAENGVLTSYEAMNLHLDKTDLVVLSACETGLGTIRQGEGVYGLQRAFLIAGAKSVIMSLWSVSDEATMDLMTVFYTNYAKTGNKTQAFNEAVKQLKTKYKQPFYWAAFVLLSR